MKIIIALLLTISLSACSSSERSERFVSNGFGSGTVKQVQLEDGTKCAVLIGFGKGAIDCNWR